jgi:hypothetical protein
MPIYIYTLRYFTFAETLFNVSAIYRTSLTSAFLLICVRIYTQHHLHRLGHYTEECFNHPHLTHHLQRVELRATPLPSSLRLLLLLR